LHGAAVSGQPSIAQFLIEGASPRCRERRRMDAAALSRGFFLANAEKVYPEVEKGPDPGIPAQGLIPEKIPVLAPDRRRKS
jgi:hypothetical protein